MWNRNSPCSVVVSICSVSERKAMRSAEPVQLPDDQAVASFDESQRLGEAGTIAAAAGGPILKQVTLVEECVTLQVQNVTVTVRGHAHVPDQHVWKTSSNEFPHSRRGWRKSSDFRHRHRSACRTHPCDFWRSSAAYTSRRSQFVPLCVSEGRFVSSGQGAVAAFKEQRKPAHATSSNTSSRRCSATGSRRSGSSEGNVGGTPKPSLQTQAASVSCDDAVGLTPRGSGVGGVAL